VREQFKEGERVVSPGRITAHRDMGKSHFLDLRDVTGRIQIYIHAKEIGPELFDLFRLLDIGDFIGVEGTCFVTKSGEPTVKVQTFQLLAKTLRPLPEKWHGLQDIEARYRQRYLDLLTNERSRAVFEKRIAIVRETRRFFEERGFVEVETPILQTMAGGAAGRTVQNTPQRTWHRSLSAHCAGALSETSAGGRVQQGIRNQSQLSQRRDLEEAQSEFTMLEAYWAYADFEKIANLVEELICHLAEKICGSLSIEHRDADGKVAHDQFESDRGGACVTAI
jgi:lysyl-tRNA synthetase class 2